MRRAWVKRMRARRQSGGAVEPGQLDRAGEAQTQLHRGRDELAVGVGGRDARHHLGVADHQVIAALGFERHLVAERGGERLRPGAGADDRGIGRQARRHRCGSRSAACRRGGTRARGPARSRRPRAGTARPGGSRGRCGLLVCPFSRTSRPRTYSRDSAGSSWRSSSASNSSISTPFSRRSAQASASFAERLGGAVDVEMAALMDQLLGAGVARQFAHQRHGRRDQRPQRARLRPHLLRRRRRARTAPDTAGSSADSVQRSDSGPSGSLSQPGTLRMMPGIATGVTDEPLNAPALPNEAPSPGLPGSIEKDAVPVALQPARRADPDHAGPDHPDPPPRLRRHLACRHRAPPVTAYRMAAAARGPQRAALPRSGAVSSPSPATQVASTRTSSGSSATMSAR